MGYHWQKHIFLQLRFLPQSQYKDVLRLMCWIKESHLVPRLLSGVIAKTGALQTSLQYLLQEFSVSLRGLLDEVPHGPSLLAWHHHTCLPKCYCHLHDGCSPPYPRSEPSGCRWWAMFVTMQEGLPERLDKKARMSSNTKNVKTQYWL